MIPEEKYAFDVKFSKALDRIVGVYYSSGSGIGLTTLSVRKYSDPINETVRLDISGEFPLAFGFLENGKSALITDSAIRIYNSSFEEIDVYQYANVSVTGFSMSASGGAISYIDESKNIVVAFDKDGKLLYNDNVYRNVTDIGVFGKYIFIRTESGVVRLDSKTNKEKELLSDQGKMLVYNESTVLICGSSKAEYLVFEDNN